MKLIKRCVKCNKIVWHNWVSSMTVVSGFPEQIRYYHFTKECYHGYDVMKKLVRENK